MSGQDDFSPLDDARGIAWFERTFGVPLGDKPGADDVEAVRARAASVADQVGPVDEEIRDLREEVDRLTDKVSDLEQEPWPKWAELVLKRMREFGVVDRFDDEIDLPSVFDEWVDGFEDACRRKFEREIETLRTALDKSGVGEGSAVDEAWSALNTAVLVVLRAPLSEMSAGAKRLEKARLAMMEAVRPGFLRMEAEIAAAQAAGTVRSQ